MFSDVSGRLYSLDSCVDMSGQLFMCSSHACIPCNARSILVWYSTLQHAHVGLVVPVWLVNHRFLGFMHAARVIGKLHILLFLEKEEARPSSASE